MPEEKKKQRNFRLSNDVYNCLTQSAEFHHIDRTKFLSELIMKGEYTEIHVDGLIELQKAFGQIGNNVNQIARILNNVSKDGTLLTEEQYKEIKQMYEVLEKIIELHSLANNEMLKKIYNIKKKKKTRNVNDETEENE